jgi:hypothetical protein
MTLHLGIAESPKQAGIVFGKDMGDAIGVPEYLSSRDGGGGMSSGATAGRAQGE